MPVDLVGGRVEERVLLVRAGGGDRGGRDHPDRDPLLPAGVEVAGVAQRQLARPGRAGCRRGVCDSPRRGRTNTSHSAGPPASRLRVRRTRPSPAGVSCVTPASAPVPCLAAYAAAASRTQAPSACAAPPVGHPLPVARAVAGDHPHQLVVVGRGEVVVPAARRSSAGPGRAGAGRATSACGTHMSTNRCRSSSLENRLIFQAIDCAEWAESRVRRAEHRQRRVPPAVHRVLGHRPLGGRAVGQGVAGSRSPAAGGTTPPCRSGSSPGRTGRRSSGTAAPG